MKKIYKYTLTLCFVITSCNGNKGGDPFYGFNYYGSNLPLTLTAYNDLKTGLDQTHKKGWPAMYVDFSAGMYTAFGTPPIKGLMTACFNTVLAQQFEVYKLAKAQVTQLQVSDGTQLGQIVNDPNQYRDVRAPIQAAVEKIVASANDALLITDFEEWQNNTEVTSTAYLKIAFSKWLKAGNSISFFIADYQEGKVSKHIYFTVFTYGRPLGHSLIDKLRPMLSAQLPKFDLATDAYLLTADYPEAKSGGLFRDPSGKDEASQNVLDLQSGYLNGLDQHKPFEYYPLGVSWATIADLRKDYIPLHQFQDILRKLYLDLSNTDSYINSEFEIKTYDITADFECFAKSIEVKKHKPLITKGNNGEDQISASDKDPIDLTCYHADGSIRPEYRYQPFEPTRLNDVFTLNQTLFANTLRRDQKKVEIGVAFSPRFAADQILHPDGLFKIELSIRQTAVNNSNPVLEKLRWTNKNGIRNVGLYASVKSTLDELKPVNQSIYAYYIKTTEQ